MHGQRSQATRGDGNCLYNAWAQALFLNKDRDKDKDRSKSLIDIISSSALPCQQEQNYITEQERIKALEPAEQKQIADDYIFALRCAGEFGYINKNLFSNIVAEQVEIYNHYSPQ